MKDDVVTLMRANAALCEPEFESAFLKAADEIERLRALLGEAAKSVRMLPVEEMIEQNPRDGSATLLGYCMQAQGEWDCVSAVLTRIDKELGND